MTENEFAIVEWWLREAMEFGEERHNAPYEKAIEALKEIQQYRAIGTVEEFKALKEKSVLIVNGEWIDTQPEHNNGYYKNAHVCSKL